MQDLFIMLYNAEDVNFMSEYHMKFLRAFVSVAILFSEVSAFAGGPRSIKTCDVLFVHSLLDEHVHKS